MGSLGLSGLRAISQAMSIESQHSPYTQAPRRPLKMKRHQSTLEESEERSIKRSTTEEDTGDRDVVGVLLGDIEGMGRSKYKSTVLTNSQDTDQAGPDCSHRSFAREVSCSKAPELSVAMWHLTIRLCLVATYASRRMWHAHIRALTLGCEPARALPLYPSPISQRTASTSMTSSTGPIVSLKSMTSVFAARPTS